MGKDYMESSLKRFLKRKAKITLGLVVSFLITGAVGYSATIEDTVNIKLENGKIIVKPEETGKLEGNTWTNSDIINVQKGNGVKVTGTGTNENFSIVNSGTISGKDEKEMFSGNGIMIGDAVIENKKINFYPTKISNITNTGNISGKGISGIGILIIGEVNTLTNNGTIFGNGYGIYGEVEIEVLTNDGTIFGNKENGIVLFGKGTGKLTNNGTIFGNKRGAEIAGGTLINNGTIFGNERGAEIVGETSINNGTILGNEIGVYGGPNILTNNGVILGKKGIYTYDIVLGKVENYGIIAESNQAIGGANNKITNYGLLISGDKIVTGVGGIPEGKEIINGVESNKTTARVVTSKELADKNKNLIINVVGKEGTAFNIDSELTLSDSTINGYKNAVTLTGKDFTGNNIIVNAGENAFTGSASKDTITLSGNSAINGKVDLGEGNDKLELKDSTYLNKDLTTGAGDDTINFSGNSIINGKIDLGAGEDELTINNAVQINKDLDGGADNDTLTFNSSSAKSTSNNLNILHNISNFENINIDSNVTLFENIKVTGAENLKITAGNQLTLRVDSLKKDADGTYKTHALYNDKDKTLNISGDLSNFDLTNDKTNVAIEESENGDYSKLSVLNIKTNGLGIDSTIALGNVHFATNDKINEEEKPNNTQNKTEVWVKTNSILNGAKVSEELTDGKYNTNIKIEAKKDLFSIGKNIIPPVTPNPDKPVDPILPSVDNDLYESLNEIYKGIYTGGNEDFNALNDIVTEHTFIDKDKDDYTVIKIEKMQLATLLEYLRNVYSETPYSFSNESTRKSLALFHSVVRDNSFKAKEDEWLIYGGLTYQDNDQEQTFYGRNYHSFDIGASYTDVNIKTAGAYGQFEYGHTDTLSTGIMIGGSNSDVKVGASKLEGTGAYVGVYAKKDIKDLRITTGIGYQYTEYDATRRTVNGVYTEDYKDTGLNLYLDGKYSYDLGNNLFIEPKAGLSYAHIEQDSIKENNSKALALNVNSKDFDVLKGNVGVDIKKVIPTEKGKHSVSVGVSYKRILDGEKTDYLTANFGGSDFELLVPHKNKGQASIGVKYEAELENGMFYDIKGNYFMNSDAKESTHKNADRGEWRVGLGFGYKFTSLKDFSLETLFDFGKSEIRPEGKEFLKNAAVKLNGRANGTLVIEGHTDSIGSEKYNQTLSEKRAEAVEKELKANVTNKKVDYSTKGYGETKPVADNNTEEGRAANRRVELKFNKR